LACDLEQAEVLRRLAVAAHDQAAAVAPGHEAVVLAAVDLHLVVVERVDQVTRDERFRQRLGIKVKQLVGRVGQALDLVFLDQVILPPRFWRAGTIPPQIFGSVGSTEPSRSFCCDTDAGTFDKGWATPGKSANRLLKLRFSR